MPGGDLLIRAPGVRLSELNVALMTSFSLGIES
jgi:hypothetical protein